MTTEAFEWINVVPVTSIIGDITIYQCHVIKKGMALLSPMEKCHINFYHGLAFTTQI